jgi:hypothetical protein
MSTTTNDHCQFIVHSLLDDLPLNPVEFRLYAHAVRRGSLGGLYWESVPKAAKHCGVRPDTLRRALKRLLKLRLFSLHEKPPGRTWTYCVNDPALWSFQPLPKQDGGPKSRGVSNREGSPPEVGQGGGSLFRGGTPPETGYTKVSPEGIPEREHNKGLGGAAVTVQVLAIYEAYPKHVCKPPGLKAIAKALRKLPFEQLLARTKEYAEHCRMTGKDPQYIPHPATWFNADRYNDALPAPPTATTNQPNNSLTVRPPNPDDYIEFEGCFYTNRRGPEPGDFPGDPERFKRAKALYDEKCVKFSLC